MNEPIGIALLFCFCCSHFLPTPHVVDCDSLYFPRLELKTWASGWKPLTFHFLTITLHFLPPPISSYFLTVSFNAWFFTLEVFFKNKLSGKNGTAAELNFWHTKYQSDFRAILLFSCGFCLKLFPFNSFAELSLVRPIKPCKGNLSWLKPKRKDNFYWSVMFIAG